MRRSRRVWAAVLVGCAVSQQVASQGREAPAVEPALRDTVAFRCLREARDFAYAAGSIEAAAFDDLASRADAAEAFAELLRVSRRPAGAVYALAGLHALDPDAHAAALAGWREKPGSINVVGAGEGRGIALRTLLTGSPPEAVRLLRSRASTARPVTDSPEKVRELLAQATDPRDLDDAAAAAARLGHAGVVVLADALGSPSESVRLAAAWRLATLGVEARSVVPTLRRAIRRCDDRELYRALGHALRDCGPWAAEAVEDVLAGAGRFPESADAINCGLEVAAALLQHHQLLSLPLPEFARRILVTREDCGEDDVLRWNFREVTAVRPADLPAVVIVFDEYPIALRRALAEMAQNYADPVAIAALGYGGKPEMTLLMQLSDTSGVEHAARALATMGWRRADLRSVIVRDLQNWTLPEESRAAAAVAELRGQ